MSHDNNKGGLPQDCDKCQSIFLNLIRIIDSDSNQKSSSYYIREFFQTARCDTFSDFSKDREAYKKHIGNAALENILNYKETDEDKRKGAQAVLHCRYWNRSSLISSLDFKNWLYYHTIH